MDVFIDKLFNVQPVFQEEKFKKGIVNIFVNVCG